MNVVSKRWAWAAAAVAATIVLPFAPLAQERALPAPLVHLRAIDPTIRQDMRYATPRNFTGRPLPGYEAAECILVEEVARALARVQRELQPKNLSLKVLDCYRPERAVRAMMAWVADKSARGATDARHHPRIARADLHRQGYIAERSEHSRGIAVDVTLVDLGSVASAAPAANSQRGTCIEPGPQVEAGGTLDMGTDYDCFDRMSHTHAAGLEPQQRAARRLLARTMTAQGFVAYSREWWHFSMPRAGPGQSYDVPVSAATR